MKGTKRRDFLKTAAAGAAGTFFGSGFSVADEGSGGEEGFKLRYMLASSMYGDLPLAEVLPEVEKTGTDLIDLWPRKHGTQRDEVEEMGHEAFWDLLEETGVRVGATTRYDLGPFALEDECVFLINCSGGGVIVTGSKWPEKKLANPSGPELKAAVRGFVDRLSDTIFHAESINGVQIAIENHGNSVISTPDSIRWLLEYCDSPHVGIALAPYHLEALGEDAESMGALIEEIGDRLFVFYAWQYGKGCMEAQPKEDELLQMPGRGSLDFAPMLRALKKINYQWYTEIFMHPYPRGIPILPTAAETTAEINRSRAYLDGIVGKL
ncbi:MAG: sugar phosphate isomerase/epimerase [Verrucomicrobiota bacterium]